jgi:RNA polymerase sigma-70 factor (ECF subfamily)
VENFLKNDTESFEVLYERYRKSLYSYLNRYLGRGAYHLADDIFQQTWLNVIKHLDCYRSRERFLAWIIRIAHNLAVDSFRKNRRQDETIEFGERMKFTPSENEPPPWLDMDEHELKKAVARAVEKLSPELKEVFLLRQDELSFREIASIQKISVNTALGRMQYALKNLRNILKDWQSGKRK